MRKVKRIATPRSLRRRELLDWAHEMTGFYARPAKVRAGMRPPFERYDKLFLGEDVVAALGLQFSDKCAYCEILLEPGQALIDPFRPTMSASDPATGEQSADHYAWLAYEWRNLVLACRECVSAKRNHFPLRSPRARPMTAWRETVALEKNLLIDPCRDEPGRHLHFLGNGRLASKDDKGAATIELLGLNRDSLVEARRQRIDHALNWVSSQLYHEVLEDFPDGSAPHWGAALSALDSVFSATMRRIGRRPGAGPRSVDHLGQLLGHAEAWNAAVAEYLSDVMDANRPSPPLPTAPAGRPSSWWPPAPVYVESIVVNDFKAIDDLRLEFPSLGSARGEAASVMLLGENAAGKSSVMQALALALMDEYQRKASRAQGIEFLPRDRENWGVLPVLPRVEVILSSGERRCVHVDALGRYRDEINGRVPMVLGYGARRFFKAHQAKTAGPARSLFDPFAVLEDPSGWLRESTAVYFEPVARAMREILALHGDDRVFRADDGHVMVQAHGRVTPVERMSDGYRALFAMAVDIMRRMVEVWGNLEYAQGIVLIDEIDVHLHPRWKIEVISALRRAMPKVQFVVTAHDALCLRGMRDGEVHVLYRDEHDRIRLREDLPNIELMRTDQLLTSDLFGLLSTARPEVDAHLHRYAYLLGKPELDAGEQRERELLAGHVSALPLGDTPTEQLIGEATERYLRGRRSKPVAERASMREDALREIVALLEAGAEREA
ncbi:AAA family ATPase [Lysobacter gummosus]|uniref:AAA family ATPase n=1 Tax=Lysobacter gummosus TaxID=262324 RepID=A0ABY3XHD2_9GAMM|nr:AAA family ATPase [Lysobacter gummosus]ALN90568.1 AAA ATPase domain protein [Lysobacter gummosus]UNP31067.1 AAA family ATPase [Lysobacter gummosus]